jgi:Flp pilus assembly protein TadD
MAPPVEVPERAMAAYSRAVNAMNAGDWVEAELELELLIQDYASFPGPYVNLSILYRRDGRIDEAETALNQALAIAPDHPIAYSELGVLYRERGDFAEAEAAYKRAIAADPSYALARYNLGVLFDLYLQREADALEQYEAYLALTPEADAEVERWVVDLRRRLGIPDEPEPLQVAQEGGP